jgi:hypothetical protein
MQHWWKCDAESTGGLIGVYRTDDSCASLHQKLFIALMPWQRLWEQ